MSMAIKDAFEAAILVEQFPQSQIDIYVQVLQGDGGELVDSGCFLSIWILLTVVVLVLPTQPHSHSLACVTEEEQDRDIVPELGHLKYLCGVWTPVIV